MDLLWFFSVLCLLCLCARLFICALWSPAGIGLTSWLSFVVSNCEFVTFHGILCQVWYMIVSIPDLCTLTYYHKVPLITNKNELAISGAQLVPIGIPTTCLYSLVPNRIKKLSTKTVSASHTF